MISLKPQDIVVALKIGLNEEASRHSLNHESRYSSNSVASLSESLKKGNSEIFRSVQRLSKLMLIGERKPKQNELTTSNRKLYSMNRKAMEDLLCYGIRHVFAPEKTGYGRGVATGWHCPYVQSEMNPPEMPLVWPSPAGNSEGEYIEPLYSTVPDIVEQDHELYSLLALIDILRIGKPREVSHAQSIIKDKLKGLHA